MVIPIFLSLNASYGALSILRACAHIVTSMATDEARLAPATYLSHHSLCKDYSQKMTLGCFKISLSTACDARLPWKGLTEKKDAG